MGDTHRRAAMAERAARAGGTVARQSFRTELQVETKGAKGDLVTEADRDAQRQVIATIREEFRSDAIVAEEDALPVGTGEDEGLAAEIPERGDAWVVDPIDGTANFARGLSLWTTSVAALVDGSAVGSATFLPVHGDAYAAGPDSAMRNGTTLAVSDESDPERFSVGLVGRWEREEADAFGDICAALTRHLGDVRRLGSMQATLALVADGTLDAVVAPSREAPWDTVAGVHLVRAAGGVVTDVDGDRWERDSQRLVASGDGAHDAVCEAVRAGLGH